MQQILGKLNFAGSTIRAGRVFVSRIINFLKEINDRGRFPLPDDFRRDLVWWKTFMQDFDGLSVISELKWEPPDKIFSSDACLKGAGGWNETEAEYWSVEFPPFLLNNDEVHINELEAFAVVIGLKVWRNCIKDKNILLFCRQFFNG